jgi:hypothetical protein
LSFYFYWRTTNGKLQWMAVILFHFTIEAHLIMPIIWLLMVTLLLRQLESFRFSLFINKTYFFIHSLCLFFCQCSSYFKHNFFIGFMYISESCRIETNIIFLSEP